MQCPNCAFENMPGTAACVRCGAVLVPRPDQAESFLPPRAGRWKRLRPLGYLIDHWWRGAIQIGRQAGTAVRIPADRVGTAMLLSVVPGLGHAAIGRWLAACIACAGWVCLVAPLIGRTWIPGVLTLWAGLLLCWHVMVIMDAGDLNRSLESPAVRLLVAMLLSCALVVVYSLLIVLLNLLDTRIRIGSGLPSFGGAVPAPSARLGACLPLLFRPQRHTAARVRPTIQ